MKEKTRPNFLKPVDKKTYTEYFISGWESVKDFQIHNLNPRKFPEMPTTPGNFYSDVIQNPADKDRTVFNEAFAKKCETQGGVARLTYEIAKLKCDSDLLTFDYDQVPGYHDVRKYDFREYAPFDDSKTKLGYVALVFCHGTTPTTELSPIPLYHLKMTWSFRL